jgi:hypothetical protein
MSSSQETGPARVSSSLQQLPSKQKWTRYEHTIRCLSHHRCPMNKIILEQTMFSQNVLTGKHYSYLGFCSFINPMKSCQKSQWLENFEFPCSKAKFKIPHMNAIKGHPLDWTMKRVNKFPNAFTEKRVLRHKKSINITWSSCAPLNVRACRI